MNASLSIVTGPVAEPVTLAEAKAHCRVEHSSDDTLISSLIVAAREYVETETRRALCTQTWDLTIHRAWPSYWDAECHEWRIGIELPRPPLVSVTSITYVDTAGDSQTLAADQYQVVKTGGQTLAGLIVPAYSVTWPSIRDVHDAISVRFVAGYGNAAAVPQRIKQAMLLLIGHLYENREAVITGTITAELAKSIDDLLFPLRVF